MAKRKPKPRPKTTPKRGRGAPSSFKPEYTAQAEKLCKLGATDAELADFFEVSITTVKNWQRAHPDFLAALKSGKEEADNRVERSLYHRAVGYEHDAVKIFQVGGKPLIVPYRERVAPDTTAAIFWLKNRQSNLWRDVSRQEVTGKDGDPIEIAGADYDAARRIAFMLGKAVGHAEARTVNGSASVGS